MKYLFDSSAIFRAIKENKVELLVGSATLELARYELGNIVWKDCILRQINSGEEATSLMSIVRRTLNAMTVHQITSEEHVLETAMRFQITFYDASYVCFAGMQSLLLVTEDQRLTKKIALSVKTLALDKI